MSAVTTKAPALAALFYIALIMPLEFSVELGSLRLSPYRVLLLVMTVPLLMRLFQAQHQRFNLVDGLIISHALWATLALAVYGGIAQGLESGGIYIVESVGAYLVGRMTITNAREHEAVLRFMITLLGVMAVFTIPESLTGQHFIREAARALVGGPGLPVIEPRLGLDRAFGSFDHPILYGVFAASTFAAAYYVLGREKLNARALIPLSMIAGSTFISLSAGPFVGLGFQAGILIWDKVTKGISLRWTALLTLFIMMWTVVSMGSNRSPIKVFISYLSFSAQSSYNRILIFEYGSAEVGRHPLLGIGFGDWIRPVWMSDSMDNFWLITAVRYGLPALILLVAAIVVLAIRQARASASDRDLNRHRMAWLAIIIGFSVSGSTVHFWNALFAYFFFLLGTGSWIAQPGKQPGLSRAALMRSLITIPNRQLVG